MSQFFSKSVITSAGEAMLDHARETGTKIDAAWRVAFGAGVRGEGDDIKALTALKDERLTCAMQSVKAAGGEMVVKAIMGNAALQKPFKARELGLYANGRLFAYAHLETGVDEISPVAKSADTSIIEFAVELDDSLIQEKSDLGAIITVKEYDAIRTDLAGVVSTVESDLQARLAGVPELEISVGGSGQPDLAPAVTANNASGAMLSAKKGIAAGTYTLQSLLQRLVTESHTHGTASVPNSGPGNCTANCRYYNCEPNCHQCSQCSQCPVRSSSNCTWNCRS